MNLNKIIEAETFRSRYSIGDWGAETCICVEHMATRFGNSILWTTLLVCRSLLILQPQFLGSSGCSAARLAHHVRDVGVGCSNHLTPTMQNGVFDIENPVFNFTIFPSRSSCEKRLKGLISIMGKNDRYQTSYLIWKMKIYSTGRLSFHSLLMKPSH